MKSLATGKNVFWEVTAALNFDYQIVNQITLESQKTSGFFRSLQISSESEVFWRNCHEVFEKSENKMPPIRHKNCTNSINIIPVNLPTSSNKEHVEDIAGQDKIHVFSRQVMHVKTQRSHLRLYTYTQHDTFWTPDRKMLHTPRHSEKISNLYLPCIDLVIGLWHCALGTNLCPSHTCQT